MTAALDTIHRLGSQRLNWYIIDDPAGTVIVDTGVPGHHDQLLDWFTRRNRDISDIAAVLLTHGHADHIGFARRLQDQGIPVWIHAEDLPLAGERRVDLPPPRLRRNLWRPSALGMLTEFIRDGITRTQGLPTAHTFRADDTIDVPGSPLAVAAPGHTPGSTAFYFPATQALFSGDALMTLDPMKGGAGATVFAARAADDWRSVKALVRLADVRHARLYPGHGEPWTDEGAVGQAVDQARLR